MVGSELNCTPEKRGENEGKTGKNEVGGGGEPFSRALLSERLEQAKREELKMLDRATIL